MVAPMKALLLALAMTEAAVPASTAGSAAACRPLVQAQGFVDGAGRKVSLAQVGRGRPLAVVVIKGEWCPACRGQLEAVSRRINEVKEAGGAVVGLSTEDPGTNRKLSSELALSFEVLSEPEARLLRQLGFWLADEGHPLPGVLFLDACGDVASVILGRQPGVDHTRQILETLERLARAPAQCRKS
jgi:peroxiredoxin